MTDWPKVKWAQARQVARLMGMKESAAPAPEVSPASWYGTLRDTGRLDEAVTFIGHALPRFEGIVWAADALEAMSRDRTGQAEAQTMAAIRTWIEDPEDDAGRRAAWDVAQAAEDDSAERLLASAVFFSGGSIAPEDQAAVTPPPELSGRLAAAAVISAAFRTPDPAASLGTALAAGEAIAKGQG